jgi:radical SAM superfamily enzyme YgiQ (UPF0313 family)
MMGVRIRNDKASAAATIIPSVGCPLGCNFCTTSAFFGGKGKFLNFFDTGTELYRIMEGMETRLGTKCFFMMDENFLLHRRRAMELLEHMRAGNKSWELYVFSSANAISKYTMDELVALGVSWVWMGLESPQSQYTKLKGADTLSLVKTLRSHGIRVLGSTIVGLEHHTPENIGAEMEHAVAHDTDFHQFMLYTPVPGTPLYQQTKDEDRLLDVNLADIHGQYKFNFKHAAISRDQSKEFLDGAFQLDYERNGPSLYRICRTMLEGWRNHHKHPEARVRERFARDARTLTTVYSAALWAMERYLRMENPENADRVRALRKEIGRECSPLVAAASSWLAGPFVLWSTYREAKRQAAGATYEPQLFRERHNWDGVASQKTQPVFTAAASDLVTSITRAPSEAKSA